MRSEMKRTLESFSRSMGKLPQLKAISSAQGDQLLRELYEAAQERQSKQGDAEDVLKASRGNRRYRQRFTRLLPKLSKVLTGIKEARKKDGALILEIENEFMDHLPETFGTLEQATQHLEALIQTAKDLEGLGAYLVHPQKRTALEKRLVTERSKVIRLYTDSSDKHSPYLPSGKFKALDHRLERKAAKILAKFQKTTGATIRSHDFVISKIFELALDRDDITPGNVHAELVRMRKSTSRKKNVATAEIESDKAHIKSGSTKSH
jgi:hypothetical protein